MCLVGAGGRRGGDGGRVPGRRKGEGEAAPHAGSGALGVNAAAVGLHAPAADGEAEPRTREAAAALLIVQAGVLPEQLGDVLGSQARALVHDGDRNVDAVAPRDQTDRGEFGRVARGVGEEVADDLHDAPSVGHDQGEGRGRARSGVRCGRRR